MSQDSKLPKTNSLLPSINYKQFISLIILLLVTSSTTQSPSAKYDCPSSCECNVSDFSAKCDDIDELIASYSQKQHQPGQNFMPIKSLDLSNNRLRKLNNQLELLVNLTELNLSHNLLTQAQKLNFERLENLDLSYNHITSAKLKKLPKNVIHLNLANNEITYLPVDFMKLKALRSLELAGNPLNCTCTTLHVRNWLSYKHVRSDNHILCTSPLIVKGQPWLQARQHDICFEPSSTTTQKSKYNWDDYEDDNEIMMADEPQSDEAAYDENVNYDEDGEKDGEKDVVTDEEKKVEEDTPANDTSPDYEDEKSESEDPFADVSVTTTPEDNEQPEEQEKSDDGLAIEDDLMPVHEPEVNDGSTVEPEAVSKPDTDLENYDEGSGGGLETTIQPEDETDESGSGDPAIFPSKDDFDGSSEVDTTVPLGIFEDYTEAPIGAQRDVIADPNVDSESIDKLSANQSGDLQKASSEDNTGTYILLGILALCLVSLMVFVAMKNRQEKSRNRRFDVEKNGATELQDMDKSLLGKPIDKNGNGNGRSEQAPLINDIHKDDRPAYTSFKAPEITVEEPKAAPRENNKSQQSLYENHPNGNGHAGPVHDSPSKSPDSDEEVFHPASESPNSPESLNVSPETPKRYSPIYTPVSPRSDRYSPVYSPETGRVKIKLTETPKPKTPLVVTRSRSRAGEYVNTPN